MTLTPHPSLPGYWNSDHGDWSFDLSEDADGTVEFANEAILAWTEWRDFLLSREHAKLNRKLDLNE